MSETGKKKRDQVETRRPAGEFDPEIRVLLAELSQEEGSLLRCLQRVQEHFGYVPDSSIGAIAELCNVSRAETFGVLTYYSDLRTVAPAAVVVRICGAEACQSVGSRELESEWHHIQEKDFSHASVETAEVFCLGNCALGPAAMINGELVGRVNPEAIAEHVTALLAKS
jgi:formate dehydrogenase subunit gamma